MKKLALVAAVMTLVVAMSFTASAQGKMYLNIGGEALLPLGTFSDVTTIGFGGTVRFEYAFMPQLHGIFTSGYLMWSGKTVSGQDLPNWSGIPLLVGAKYYFMPEAKGKMRVYGQAELGLMILSIGSKKYTIGNVTLESPSASETDFALAPTVGVEFPISDAGVLDISAKYLLIAAESSASNIGFRLGYKFPLN